MKKQIWFDWKRGESLPYWLNGSSPDYKVGEDGVCDIREIEGPFPAVLICYCGGIGSWFVKVVGVPYIIITDNKSEDAAD
jgi:hypothetical protein